jgi:hypothetical protein
VLALVLASCGEKPEPQVPVTPTPTATQQLKEPDEGDEDGVRVDVMVRVSARPLRVSPRTVAAFLPLRFKVTNTTRRRVFVRITGQQALQLGAGLSASEDSRGEKPGRLTIRAGRRHATVRVKPGG